MGKGNETNSGFVAQKAAPWIDDSKVPGGKAAGVIERTLAASVAGGTASILGGGKFKNGAIKAVFFRLFNSELQSREMDTSDDLYHEYEFETKICSRSSESCTPNNVWNAIKNHSVPFQDSQLYDGAKNNIPAIGRVVTHVEDANYRLVNETLPRHEIECGTVERSLVVTQDTISVRTFGVGVNTSRAAWLANYAASAYFPQILGRYIRAEVNR